MPLLILSSRSATTATVVAVAIALRIVAAGDAAAGPALASDARDHAASSRAAPAATQGGATRQVLVADRNQLHLSVSNFGVLGNNFISRDASLEYPALSGYEHLTHAGLWVGAQAVDGSGAFTGVATGGFDQSVAVSAGLLSEFMPVTPVIRRSTILSDPTYSPDAVSEADYISHFDDLTPYFTWNNPEQSRPMGLEVRSDVYSWSTVSLSDIVFVRYVVRSQQPLTNVWLGVFAELASGPKGSYVNWPPNSNDPSGLGAWFSKKWVVYEDSLRLMREHYCASQPVPGGCILNRTPPWIGMKLLTPPAPGQELTVAGWPWSPSAPWRNQDFERYALMSSGLITSFNADSLLPATGDPVELVAIGPFTTLAPGDSAEIAVAFLGAPDEETLRQRARLAQQVADVGYSLALTPTEASWIGHRLNSQGLWLTWWSSPDAPAPYSVEREDGANGWVRIGTPWPMGSDRYEFLDAFARPGGLYRYRLRWANGDAGGEAVVALPSPDPARLRVIGAQPVSDGTLAFGVVLPSLGSARLEVFEITGRRVASREIAVTSSAEQVVGFGEGSPLPPGVYLATLRQAGIRAQTRFVVVE